MAGPLQGRIFPAAGYFSADAKNGRGRMSTDTGKWPQPPVVFGEWADTGTEREPGAFLGSVGSIFPLFLPPAVDVGVGVEGEGEAREPLAEPLETAEAPADATTEAAADGPADASWEFAPAPEDVLSPAAEELETEVMLDAPVTLDAQVTLESEASQEFEAIQEPEAVREPGALEESEGLAEPEVAREETPTSVGPERQLTAGTAGTWMEEEPEAGDPEAGDPVMADAGMEEVIGEEFHVVEAEGDAEVDTPGGGGAPTAEAPPLPGPSEEVAVLLERLAEELRRTGDIPFDPDGRESTRLEGLLRGMLAGYLAHLRGGDR